VDALLAAIQSAPNDLTLVLTLRADFLSYLLNYPTFGEALQQHKPQLLGAMNREEMREAIERPAKEMGVKLEEALTERILDAVKREPGNLPLLEFALEQLWARQKNNRLTHDAYDDIKGVEKALAEYAQAVYEELTQKIDGKQIQQIFIQLVRVGEGTEDTRQLATRAEVGGDNWDLVRQLADKRLVVTGRNEATGEETVEVVHEALIREWGLLRQWIDENRKKLIQKREIEDAAKRWGDRGKAKDYLLGGKVLTEAKVFHKQEGGNLRLSDFAKDFIGQSLRQRRNNRIKFVELGLIVSLGLAVFAGREIRIRQLWAIVNSERIDSPVRIKALQELVNLNISSYVNLSDVDFGGADFSGTFLFNANLKGANLSGTILSRTILANANFSGADLSSADLSSAKISNANLNSANLNSADFSNADLSAANLRDANLNYAIFIDTNLSQANFNSANLSEADFSNANLSGADLSNANLNSANLDNADLNSANLNGADFTDAINLTPEQVKSAKNWQQAESDEEFRKKLGLK
jgi:uncharacterized protein YjbI with pentapeptide repeats